MIWWLIPSPTSNTSAPCCRANARTWSWNAAVFGCRRRRIVIEREHDRDGIEQPRRRPCARSSRSPSATTRRCRSRGRRRRRRCRRRAHRRRDLAERIFSLIVFRGHRYTARASRTRPCPTGTFAARDPRRADEIADRVHRGPAHVERTVDGGDERDPAAARGPESDRVEHDERRDQANCPARRRPRTRRASTSRTIVSIVPACERKPVDCARNTAVTAL